MKRIVMMAVAACLCMAVQAQHVAGEFFFVPKVGVDLSKFTNDNIYTGANLSSVVKPSYKEGLTAGVDVEYFFHAHGSLSAGTYYMNMGSRHKDYMEEGEDGGEGFSRSHTTLEYLQVPVMGGLYFDNGLAVKTGIQMGWLIHSKTYMEMQSWTFNEDDSRNYQEPIKMDGDINDEWKQKFYFGIPVALSYEYQNVVLEARYVRSLTHPLKSDTYSNSHHSTFVFTVGYRL